MPSRQLVKTLSAALIPTDETLETTGRDHRKRRSPERALREDWFATARALDRPEIRQHDKAKVPALVASDTNALVSRGLMNPKR